MFSALLLAVSIVTQSAGYYTSMANHVKRWLGEEGVPSQVITSAQMPKALEKESIVFLVGFEKPTTADLKALQSFRSRGGRIVVLYSGSTSLASLMGVKIVGYASEPYPGAWSTMVFASNYPEGVPSRIRQASTVLVRARPEEGKGRVLATWYDRKGRSTGEPAWISTRAGYWMTHLLLPDGDEDLKAQLVGAIVGSVNPKLWSPAVHNKRVQALAAARRNLAVRQVPRKAEIHAVWDHTGAGLYPGDWPRTMRVLHEARVTDLFVNVAGAGFAHYPSSILPRSKLYQQEGDQLAKCLAAARGTGIRVHAWILCFSATRATSDKLADFSKKGWRLKTTSGKLTEYLSPAHPSVREYVLSAVEELQRYPVAGVHLDFVRWGDGTVKPANAEQAVTQFVTAARQRVKSSKWLTAAVYGKYPQCVSSVGQDWERWIDLGLVNYVVPMNYTGSLSDFENLLKQQSRTRTHTQRTIIGIGVTANESRLDARDVINQINLTRKYGFPGNSLFDLDTVLEKSILPYLKLGIW